MTDVTTAIVVACVLGAVALVYVTVRLLRRRSALATAKRRASHVVAQAVAPRAVDDRFRVAASAALAAISYSSTAELSEDERSTLVAIRFVDTVRDLARRLDECADVDEPAAFAFEQIAANQWDEALANLVLVKGYFSGEPAWAGIGTAIDAVLSLVGLSLLEFGVKLDLPLPLSLAERDRPESTSFDLRSLKAMRAIRNRVLAAARSLRSGEVMVVDCSSPGWRSERFGDRKPSLVLFNPASWI
jgi:hypothetical protein